MLAKDFNVEADVWSATSFNLLAKEGREVERWNLLHPQEPKKEPYITQVLKNTEGPIVAATDYIKQYSDQVRAFVPRHYAVLGTDGFGRSDSRENLRSFFEVNRYYIALVALNSLAEEGKIDKSLVSKAIELYHLNPEKPNPLSC